jgi:lipoate-protein ligase A
MWRFLNTGFHAGTFNMAFDERLAAELTHGHSHPTLRVYGWSPHAISVGRHQPMEAFDIPELGRAGIDIVRRPTGGKAILHARELTYSVAIAAPGGGLRDLYRRINVGILQGLRILGIKAELQETGSDFRALHADPSAVACFSSFARSEIQFEGRKLIGSAQRRYGNVVLQHGSFLLDDSHLDIARYLTADRTPGRDAIRALLEESTCDARAILGREVGFQEAAEAIRDGFARAWEIEFTDQEPAAAPERMHSHV